MALTEYVYDPAYPNNTKTVTIDLARRVPVGESGDEKYILTVSTSAYSNVTNRTTITPIIMYETRRGWADSFIISYPVTLSDATRTLSIAIDEANSGAITMTLPSGQISASNLASHIQTELRNTASGSGAKVNASNRLSYLNAQVLYEEGRLRILSGSVKNSYNNTSNWSNTSSVKVTGGNQADTLGFGTGYPNSFDLATTSSGEIHQPGSAVVTIDDAVTFGIMSLVNQIDFSG